MTAHKLVRSVATGCTIVMLSAVALFGAEKSPLLGLTREQLLDQQGEPRSQIAAGGREVMFFARERVVLRNGVVVEVDNVAPDYGARRAAPTTAPAPAPATAATPADPTPAAADVTPQVPAPTAASTAAATADAPAPVAPPEPQLSIKSVRPPSAGSVRPAPKAELPPAPAPVAAPVAAAPKADAVSSTAKKTVTPPDAANSAPVAPVADQSPAPAPVATEPVAAASEPPTAEPAAPDGPDATDTAVAAEMKTARTALKRPAGDADFPEPEEAIFTGRSYLIALLTIGAGVGFLIWRNRQRQLELAASAVSRPPFSIAPAAAEGALFPGDLLASLEWKRFEELVAAYYSKTGVVAVRTKAGPESPVHIKISWKGESRPFALVQCIAHPVGLVDAVRIQELFAVLSAEDIRRGYVVTTGKFNVTARDFAEEKHITLLSGDLLLEKVNALPPPVRAELLQEFSVGDYTTPSCPKCDAKMVQSDEDPKIWQCKVHPDATIRAWK